MQCASVEGVDGMRSLRAVLPVLVQLVAAIEVHTELHLRRIPVPSLTMVHFKKEVTRDKVEQLVVSVFYGYRKRLKMLANGIL